MQRTGLFLLLFFIAGKIPAQSTDSSDTAIAYYFDDEITQANRNIIKLKPLAFLHGNYAFFYERILSRSWSAEVGLGFLSASHLLRIDDFWISKTSNMNHAYGFWLQGKYYFKQNNPESNYVGLQWRSRHFHMQDHTLKSTHIFFNYGFQCIAKKRWTLEYNIGVGVRLRGISPPLEITNTRIEIVPFSVKLGFLI